MSLHLSRLLLSSLLASALAFAAACATPVSQDEVEMQLERAGEPFAALGPRRIIPIYAESKMVALGLLTEAKTQPESRFSTRLGRKLARAHQRHLHVVVGGPYPKLSDRVLANAFRMNREPGLPGLTVVFVSAKRPSPELADAASLAQARLHHRPLP